MAPSDDTPLTDDELDALDDFLVYELDDAMDLSTLDGYFTAILSGPATIPIAEWLRWVWDAENGEESPDFKSQGVARTIIGLLIRYMNSVALALHEETEPYEPLLLEGTTDDDPEPVLDEWCWGFVKGMSLDAQGWQPLLDAHPEWMDTIMLYGSAQGMDAQEASDIALDEHRAHAASLPEDVRRIYAWWLERRAATSDEADGGGPRFVRREPARNPDKVGRNDPCPCGSGRKFKQCHGAGGPTVH